MSQIKVTRDMIDQMHDWRAQGLLQHQIAAALGVSQKTVSRYLGEHMGQSKRRSKVTSEVCMEMRRLRENGMTNREIARKMGLCRATVVQYLGAQPSGLRADYGAVAAHVTEAEPAPQPETPVARKPIAVTLAYRIDTYSGRNHFYKVDSLNHRIKIFNREHSDQEIMTLTPENLVDFMTELGDLAGILQDQLA